MNSLPNGSLYQLENNSQYHNKQNTGKRGGFCSTCSSNEEGDAGWIRLDDTDGRVDGLVEVGKGDEVVGCADTDMDDIAIACWTEIR